MTEQKTYGDRCHCGGKTKRYRSYKFVNQRGMDGIKLFHQCENCNSRFLDITIPAIDNAKSRDIFSLTNQK